MPAARPSRFRLPADVRPSDYHVHLQPDLDAGTFVGEAHVVVRLAKPRKEVVLHAAELTIEAARVEQGGETVAARVAVQKSDDTITLTPARPLAAGEAVLHLRFRGALSRHLRGFYAARSGEHRYAFTQCETADCRRILPCFDEPRFKAAWRVTLVVPGDAVALGNAPTAHERVLPDGRREVQLAEIGPLPTYLFAVAVGPFELVDAGPVGRARLPLRIAVLHGETARATFARATTPALVAGIEAYLDLAMPWPKLDLVEVPHLFGAMEHVGLITFDGAALIGDADDVRFTRRFVRVASHELAHQWFGNSVTHAWWDDLWLAEAFASWIADKLSESSGGFDDPTLRRALSRELAIAADGEARAQPLRRQIRDEADVERTFDAIAYDKGAAVLAMFEQFVGPEKFRDAIRSYLHDHAMGSATAADVVGALANVTTPAIGQALASYLDRAGTPVVDLAVRCEPTPVLVAEARAGARVPLCARYQTPAGPQRVCALVGTHTEVPLSSCPRWILGNAGGVGYYEAAWRTLAVPPVAQLSSGERIIVGADVAASVRRGDTAPAQALAALRELAGSHDAYAMVGALAIARAIDPLVDDATRDRWARWLAARISDRVTPEAVFAPRSPAERTIRQQVLELLPGELFDRATRARARGVVAKLDAATDPTPELDLAIAITAPRGGRALFDTLLAVIRATKDRALGDALLEDLGDFGPELAPRVVETALAEDTRGAAATQAIVALLDRTTTRTAAWRAIRDRWDRLVATLPGPELRSIVGATGGLCDSAARAEVAATLEPRILDVIDGPRTLAASLAAIERCLSNRTRFGDLGSALAR